MHRLLTLLALLAAIVLTSGLSATQARAVDSCGNGDREIGCVCNRAGFAVRNGICRQTGPVVAKPNDARVNICNVGQNAQIVGCRCLRPNTVGPTGICNTKTAYSGKPCQEGMNMGSTGCRCMAPMKAAGRLCVRLAKGETRPVVRR